MAIPKHWRQYIELWQNSDLSQAGHCLQEGLNRKTFSARLSELRSDPTSSAVLIPIQVEAILSSHIVLHHGKGHWLELPPTVSATWLGELLSCLD